MTYVWQASFWCEKCGQDIINPIHFENWADEPSENEKAGPSEYLKRLHYGRFHIHCASCKNNKGMEEFKECGSIWDGTDVKDICDACLKISNSIKTK